MAEIIGSRGVPRRGLAPLGTERSGAVTVDTPYLFDPTNQGRYRGALAGGGFAAVQVVSPINAAGAADLDIEAAGQLYFLAGGGNTLTVPGPVWSVKVTPRNASVGGTGSDQVSFIPIGRL